MCICFTVNSELCIVYIFVCINHQNQPCIHQTCLASAQVIHVTCLYLLLLFCFQVLPVFRTPVEQNSIKVYVLRFSFTVLLIMFYETEAPQFLA